MCKILEDMRNETAVRKSLVKNEELSAEIMKALTELKEHAEGKQTGIIVHRRTTSKQCLNEEI